MKQSTPYPEAMVLLCFLPKIRSKDLWPDESGTTDIGKMVENIFESTFERSSVSHGDYKAGIGQFKQKRAYSGIQGHVLRSSDRAFEQHRCPASSRAGLRNICAWDGQAGAP